MIRSLWSLSLLEYYVLFVAASSVEGRSKYVSDFKTIQKCRQVREKKSKTLKIENIDKNKIILKHERQKKSKPLILGYNSDCKNAF